MEGGLTSAFSHLKCRCEAVYAITHADRLAASDAGEETARAVSVERGATVAVRHHHAVAVAARDRRVPTTPSPLAWWSAAGRGDIV